MRDTVRRLAVLLCVLVTACTPPPAGDEGADGDPQTGQTTETADGAGGTLVVARTGDIDNLDPHLATAFQTYQTLELVYDTLFELDPELNVVPGLATEHAYSEDGATLTLQLREGVTFHDGDAFDAEDAVASIERIRDEDTGAVALANLASIESVEASGDLEVTLSLSRPDAALPAALADPNTAMLSAAAVEADTIASEPNGTGPFTFGGWEQGRSVSLGANADYWGEGPAVDGVEFRVIPDESSVLAGLQADEFSMGVLSDPSVVTQIDESELQVARTPALAYRALMLNTTVEPLGDERVRQAIACALDRDEIIQTALFGEGEVTGPFTIPAYESDPYAGLPCDGQDLDVARDLLAEAGQDDGFSLNTIVMTGQYSTATAEAQAIQAQLAEVGVDLQLEQLETNVYVDRWLAADFDAAVALNGGRPDPHHMYSRYFTSDGNLNQVATYADPELDDLFEQGLTQTDQATRERMYSAISEHLLDASPWAWLFTGYEYRVLQPEVSGFTPMPTGSLKSLRSTTLGGG